MEKEKPGRVKTEPAGGLLNCFCEEKPGKSWKLTNPSLALRALIVGSLVFSKPGRTVSLYCMAGPVYESSREKTTDILEVHILEVQDIF